MNLIQRLRRQRSTQALRDLVQETRLHPSDFVQPIFVAEEGTSPEPLAALPGIERVPLDRLGEYCAQLWHLGLRAAALFPVVPEKEKNANGSYALEPENLVCRSVRRVKASVPQMLVVADVALDPFTTHGHDGVLDPISGDVDNDATVEILAEQAVLLANSGADILAPSDMMDGRVAAIRKALDRSSHHHAVILSYAAKFASCLYGPFRDAVGSAHAAGTPSLDKRTYQLNPANRREALWETALDEEEGADMLMVKPAGFYLDVISMLRQRTLLPIAAYQVSGEYAMIQAAGRLGWLDGKRARDESLLAIKRAGADIILSYFAEAWIRDHYEGG
ncbi:MAG: porphobilinogen synthase [Verrucomicrobiales bacterium]